MLVMRCLCFCTLKTIQPGLCHFWFDWSFVLSSTGRRSRRWREMSVSWSPN